MEIYNSTYCVYIHTNKINGKKYVGQTCQKPEYRWKKDGRGYRSETARRVTGINHIDDVCRGDRKSAGGFIWKYAKEVA